MLYHAIYPEIRAKTEKSKIEVCIGCGMKIDVGEGELDKKVAVPLMVVELETPSEAAQRSECM